MKAQFGTRTVTTESTFEDFADFLASDNPEDIVENELAYEHTLTDPRCDPKENEYETDGPHEFRLKKRKTITVIKTSPTGQSSSGGGEEQIVEELVIHLSDSVREMYAGWTMSWKFTINIYTDNGRESISDTPEGSRILKKPVITPYSDLTEWKTITVANVMELRNLLEGYHDHDDLEFKVTWSRQEPSLSHLDRIRRELEMLKRAMAQTQSMLLGIFNRPSVDITRLVFRSKRSGTLKYLYVPSNVLIQYEYFQTCHSIEYSETQHADKTKRKREELEKPSKELDCDDSDDEWDSDTEDVEPEKNATFKATIHVTGTSRKTY